MSDTEATKAAPGCDAGRCVGWMRQAAADERCRVWETLRGIRPATPDLELVRDFALLGFILAMRAANESAPAGGPPGRVSGR